MATDPRSRTMSSPPKLFLCPLTAFFTWSMLLYAVASSSPLREFGLPCHSFRRRDLVLAGGRMGQTSPEAMAVSSILWKRRGPPRDTNLKHQPIRSEWTGWFLPTTDKSPYPEPNFFSQSSKVLVQELDLCEGYLVSTDEKNQKKGLETKA